MDFKQIQELVKMVNKSSITELSIEQDKFRITIKREHGAGETPPMIQVPAIAAMPQVAATPQPAAAEQPATPPPPSPAPPADNLIVIKSPMIGTFYRSPSPDKPAFVNVGDEVTPGKVVCIIEAMKLFNEIESEVSGKIVKVLADDTSPVEYDQPLFLVEPA